MMGPDRPAVAALRAAVLMEESGQVFYDSLAAATENPSAALLFRRLSVQENLHRKAFKQMLEILQCGTSDWDEADDERTREWVKASMLPDPAAIKAVAFQGNARNAIELAVELELQAVSFYQLLLEAAPNKDRNAIRVIIEQEDSHAKDLKKLLLGTGARSSEEPSAG